MDLHSYAPLHDVALAPRSHRGVFVMEGQVCSILDGYLTLDQTAKELGIHVVTLKRWKARRYGPVPVRVGSRWYYRRDDWRTFFENEDKSARRRSRGG